jgi:hypothetical protein
VYGLWVSDNVRPIGQNSTIQTTLFSPKNSACTFKYISGRNGLVYVEFCLQVPGTTSRRCAWAQRQIYIYKFTSGRWVTSWWRQQVPLKRRYTSTRQHDVTTRKIANFKDQLGNGAQGKKSLFTLESYKTNKYKIKSYLLLKQVGHIITIGLQRVNTHFVLNAYRLRLVQE